MALDVLKDQAKVFVGAENIIQLDHVCILVAKFLRAKMVSRALDGRGKNNKNKAKQKSAMPWNASLDPSTHDRRHPYLENENLAKGYWLVRRH